MQKINKIKRKKQLMPQYCVCFCYICNRNFNIIMAMELINKYVWLVDTIYRAGRITFEGINQKWLDQDMDEKPIPLRTFHKWKIAAEEMFQLSIECERKGGYHYYIENVAEIKRGGFRNWILKTLSVSNLLLDSQSLKDLILLEEVPSGQEYLALIIDAMKANRQITITYQSFWQDKSSSFDVDPYCVKLFKQRWYLVAYNSYYDKVRIYGLDRILDIVIGEEHFDYPDDFEPDEFFEGCVGVFVDEDIEIEEVCLKVTTPQTKYLRSLPLHSSQRETEQTDSYSIFTYQVRPTFDFQQEILSMGDAVEVLYPQWLRGQIAERIKNLWERYESVDKN